MERALGPTALSEHSSDAVELAGHLGKHSSSAANIRDPHSFKRGSHGEFDRPWRGARIHAGARVQVQPRAPTIPRIASPLEESPANESLQDAGDRPRVQSHNMSEFAGRQSRKPTNDPQHQPLRSGESKLTFHPLGHSLKTVLDGPQQSHEIQNWVQCVVNVGRRLV